MIFSMMLNVLSQEAIIFQVWRPAAAGLLYINTMVKMDAERRREKLLGNSQKQLKLDRLGLKTVGLRRHTKRE